MGGLRGLEVDDHDFVGGEKQLEIGNPDSFFVSRREMKFNEPNLR